MKNLKVKPLTKEKLIISIDRLTRFKQGKYLRVFCDVITGNLIEPKYKKNDLENIKAETLRDLAEYIINYSLQNLGLRQENDFSINQKLYEYENSVFELDQYTKTLINNKIDYKSFIKLIDKNSAKNLKWLKALNSDKNIEQIRAEEELCFPIKMILIVEGATEETLLPEFAKLLHYNFDKNGIYVIPAGGKNQVVKTYYKLAETLKLPMFVLLDKDAEENIKEITPRLRKNDKIHLLKCGEFEDLLPPDLINRTIKDEFGNISIVENDLLQKDEKRVKILEEFFKTRGMHDFKKAEFASMIKAHIQTPSDVTEEITEIIKEINKVVDN